MTTELFPGKHLFVDDYRIQEMRAARRVLHQPEKHPGNPVLRPERPWEEAALHAGAFLYDEERGCFRLPAAPSFRTSYATPPTRTLSSATA